MRAHKNAVAITTFLLVYILHPATFFGCAGKDPAPFNFGMVEMQQLLDDARATGRWEFERDNVVYAVELEFTEAAADDDAESSRDEPHHSMFVQRAFACGTTRRNFGAVASACDDVYETQLALSANATLSRAGADGVSTILAQRELQGYLHVEGRDLEAARELSIHLEGDGLNVELTRQSVDEEYSLLSIIDRKLQLRGP